MIQPIPFALLMALAMGVAWRRSGKAGFLALALLWAIYAGYETLMYKRVLCSGECNIRVDLLLIYPALLGATLWLGLAAVVRAWRRRRGAGPGA